MSEILESYKKRKIEWALKIGTEFPLHYVKQQASQQYEFLFCVEIPWPLLRLWSELVEGTSLTTSYIDRYCCGWLVHYKERVLTYR